MKKLFVPFETSLELKNLGFDDDCFDYYLPSGKPISEVIKGFPNPERFNSKTNTIYKEGIISAPLWRQAFDFLKYQYGLEINYNVYYPLSYVPFVDFITSESMKYKKYVGVRLFGHRFFETKEEAEYETLNKLIEIIKLEKDGGKSETEIGNSGNQGNND